MEHIVDHEIIKSWDIYKSIIYIKYGLYIGPYFVSNVDQYIKPLTNFKNAQGSPKKRAKTQRYRYSASLLSIENRLKNNNLQSRFSRSFCYSLAKSKRFCTFDIASQRTKVKRSCRGLRVAPLFWPIMVQKIHCVFRPTFVASKKSARITHRKNCSTQFLLAHFLLIK